MKVVPIVLSMSLGSWDEPFKLKIKFGPMPVVLFTFFVSFGFLDYSQYLILFALLCIASDKVSVPDGLGHAVGAERFELLNKLAGNEVFVLALF